MTDASATAAPTRDLTKQDLRERIIPLAMRVSRLGSVAQLLARPQCREGSSELLALVKGAGQAIKQLQALLGADRVADAAHGLQQLERGADHLEARILKADAELTAAELRRHLAESSNLPGALLLRLLEYYARPDLRIETTRKKFLACVDALAERDDLPGTDSNTIRLAMQMHRLGLSDDEGLSPELMQQAADLAERLSSPDELRDSEWPDLERAVAGFRDELDEMLFTLPGVSEVLALHRLLARRRQGLEDSELQSYVELANDLESLGQEPGPPVPVPATVDDDPDTIDMLRTTEAELRAAVRADETPEQAHLDASEREAAQGRDEDTEWATLILRSAACRTCINRLASAHAAGSTAAGESPSALPRERAATLVHHACLLERQLQDAVHNDIFRGDTQRAKSTTRSLHRLSRAKLGLAILAELPAEEGGTLPEIPRASQERDEEEAKLQGELEKARLLRDALTEKDNPREVRKPGLRLRSKALSPGSRQRVMLAVLVIVAVATGAYHVQNWQAGSEQELPQPEEFQNSVPLKSVTPVKSTFVATAQPGWENLAQDDLRQKVGQLWNDVQQRGYQKMILMSTSGQRPVAHASTSGVILMSIK